MPDQSRPDPDELLSRIAAEESEAEKGGRGRLKIFFGACAGVGKTYSMLNAAQQAIKEKRNAVIGVVETHGREETLKLAEGIPVIPLRSIQYRTTTLKEFDIDAALAMKPDLILLDELAHTNAPGSRHPKRWHDVEEMLAAGIDVYTTLNVQHLESLNDVVARITGVWVKETVPDALFDSADEISLVDIPSEELLKRLKEGKVYIAPGAKRRAAQNFFRKGNLIALRELALRRTAERVDALMDKYKIRTGTMQSWSAGERILVCIGPDVLSGKLVRVAKRMANSLRAPWTAIYIENERHYRLSKSGQEAVERNLRLAERMGGKAETITGGKASDEIIAYARAHGITKIIVGKTTRPRWREILSGTLADHIIRRSEEIDVYVVTGSAGEETKNIKTPFWRFHSSWGYYLSAPLASLLPTALLLPARRLVEPFNLSVIYLVAIVTVALQFGRGPALVTTLLSALAFNYYLLDPFYTFKLTDQRHLVPFFVLLIAGLLIATQTSRLRLQAAYARRREQNTSALYSFTRELTANRGKETLIDIAARHIGEVFDSDLCVWLPDEKGNLAKVMDDSDESDGEKDALREESAARWAYLHRQQAGRGTETLPSATGFYIPLIASGGVMGVIGLFRGKDDSPYTSDQVDMLETFANIAASAIERAAAAELMEKTMVETESEKLRNILLSSVSHDLRTPLAGITGAASTLLLEGQKITEEYRDELLRLVHEEAARLARMVTNLLDVTSLQTGSVRLNRELYFIEELIGSALMRVEPRLGKRKVTTRIEHGLPLVRMDGLLIEQVLINLLENVADHTEDGTEVTISATLVKPDLHVIISDNGPGLPPGDEEHIFDRFYSASKDGTPAPARDGGLGLAICRGIISAHGGKIWAQNNPEGGSIFTFTLPVRALEGDAA